LDPAWGPAHRAALHAALADTALAFLVGNVGEQYSRAMTLWVGRLAQDIGCLTIAVVSTCVPRNARQDIRQVEADLHTLCHAVDALLPLSVQRVWQVTECLPTWQGAGTLLGTGLRPARQGVVHAV